MAQVKAKQFLLALIFSSYICLEVNTTLMDDKVRSQSHSHWMVQNSDPEKEYLREKRSTERSLSRHKRYIEEVNQADHDKCTSQGKQIATALDSTNEFKHNYKFENETKISLGLAWLGKNKGVILAIVTEEMFIFAKKPSIFLSKNDGRTFEDWVRKVDPSTDQVMVKKDNGLQKHPTDPDRVYLIAHHNEQGKCWLYRSTDAGMSFKKFEMDFNLMGSFVFHVHEEKQDHILALEIVGPMGVASGGKLHMSINGGETWKKIAENVISYKWGFTGVDSKVNKDRVYFSHYSQAYIFQGKNKIMLSYTDNIGETVQTLQSDIFSFGVQGKFLFTSIHIQEDRLQRLMKVSTDGGVTWAETQLPTITSDRFYSILDMSEQMIFMHVDNPGESGHGTIYTSDAMGVVFSESLERHLYPNYEDFTDFYKVDSLRGVYIASQISADNSIHTMITYDRGGRWQSIRRPSGNTKCKDETKACFLQIHNLYSISSGVPAKPPLSTSAAPGIILVHGHIADALQTTKPDVYASSDGGYNWIKALDGPHHYQIADQGGLLVAVSADTQHPKVLKFSTDEGRCWHKVNFTTEDIVLTGLLTEPGNQAMSVAIWGYGAVDRVWRTYTFNFSTVISRTCINDDYETWHAHSDGANEGCLLGKKETFDRLKKESICHNMGAIKKEKVETLCKCTKDDYECDYGYKRTESDICAKDTAFVGPEIDICFRGHEKKIVTEGYRKLPGDKCEHGFNPNGQLVDLHSACKEDSKNDVEKDMGETPAVVSTVMHRGNMVVMGTVGVLVMITMVILTLFMVRRYRELKRRNASFLYSKLTSDTAADEELPSPNSLYEDSSDEEGTGNVSAPGEPLSVSADPIRYSTQIVPPTMPVPAQPAQPTHLVPPTQPPTRSYHDDSDDDMLA